jgi:hypothetical protein
MTSIFSSEYCIQDTDVLAEETLASLAWLSWVRYVLPAGMMAFSLIKSYRI